MFSERVSIHFTGRFRLYASAETRKSSQYAPIFWPKPPPTSGAMQRTWFCDNPRLLAIELRFQCGAWVEVQTVSPRVIGSGAAATARGSIGTALRRLLRIRALTVCGAEANAA